MYLLIHVNELKQQYNTPGTRWTIDADSYGSFDIYLKLDIIRFLSLADWYELHNPGFGWVHTNGSAKYQDFINIPDKRQGNGFVPNFVMVAD